MPMSYTVEDKAFANCRKNEKQSLAEMENKTRLISFLHIFGFSKFNNNLLFIRDIPINRFRSGSTLVFILYVPKDPFKLDIFSLKLL